jgi:hypothetical protein
MGRAAWAIALALAFALAAAPGDAAAHGRGHAHWGGHHHHGPRVVVGVGPAFWWGPAPWYGAPWYGARWYGLPPYYAYGPPPVIVERPSVYVERAPAPAGYWYYCESAGAYYPQVSSCPEPWLKVAPRPE